MLQALNCMSIFGPSRAEVTVGPSSGVVQYHRILNTPLREDVSRSDAFQWRNVSEDGWHKHSYISKYGNKHGDAVEYDVLKNFMSPRGEFSSRHNFVPSNIP